MRADAIEADVWGEIEGLFSDLDRLWSELKAAQASEEDRLEPVRDKLQSTDDFIKHAEGELDEIATALRAAQGRLVERFEKQQDEVNARLDSLFRQREKLITELGARKLSDERVAAIMEYARNVQAGIQNADYEAKRRMLESLGVKVKVKEGRYSIICVIGQAEGEIRKIPRNGIDKSAFMTIMHPMAATETSSR